MTVIIECSDCSFRKEFGPEEETLPADVLIAHGEENGHRLRIKHDEV